MGTKAHHRALWLALASLLSGCQGGDPGGSGGESDSFASVPTVNPTASGTDSSGTESGTDTTGGPITTSGADCAVWQGDCIPGDDSPKLCTAPSECCSEYSHESCKETPEAFPHNWSCVGGECIRAGGCLVDADCGSTGFSCLATVDGELRFCVLACAMDAECAPLPDTTCSGQTLDGLYCAQP